MPVSIPEGPDTGVSESACGWDEGFLESLVGEFVENDHESSSAVAVFGHGVCERLAPDQAIDWAGGGCVGSLRYSSREEGESSGFSCMAHGGSHSDGVFGA